MTTMLLIGLWHRLSSGYLVFGLLHGGFMIGSVLTAGVRARWLDRLAWLAPLRRAFGVMLTFSLVALAQTFPRATTWRGGLASLALIWRAPAHEAPLPVGEWVTLVLCASAAFAIGSGLLASFASRRALLPRWLGYALALLALLFLAAKNGGPFIYVGY
jgi:D-alanyl-lipoteichoic acid acyltransferase DltB (MBOAT superfamily)